MVRDNDRIARATVLILLKGVQDMKLKEIRDAGLILMRGTSVLNEDPGPLEGNRALYGLVYVLMVLAAVMGAVAICTH